MLRTITFDETNNTSNSPLFNFSLKVKYSHENTFLDNLKTYEEDNDLNLIIRIFNRYYVLSNSNRKYLLDNLIYNDNLFNSLIELLNYYELDSNKTEIIKILLSYFPKNYLDEIYNFIIDENKSLFSRLFLLEAIPFLIQYDKNKRIEKLNEAKDKINNKHVLSFLQETLESLKE